MKEDAALWVVGVLLGLLIGFMVGREFPRETLRDKECRVWAERTVRDMNDPNRFALLFGACTKGFR